MQSLTFSSTERQLFTWLSLLIYSSLPHDSSPCSICSAIIVRAYMPSLMRYYPLRRVLLSAWSFVGALCRRSSDLIWLRDYSTSFAPATPRLFVSFILLAAMISFRLVTLSLTANLSRSAIGSNGRSLLFKDEAAKFCVNRFGTLFLMLLLKIDLFSIAYIFSL